MNRAACLAILSLWSAETAAQAPRVSVAPVAPAPGSVVRLAVEDTRARDGAIVGVSGQMAGEPLHFVETVAGTWRALGGISVDASDSVVARVVLEYSSGHIEAVRVFVAVPRLTATRPPQNLAVASRFTQPLDAATQARIARENARAREIGRRAHSTPRLWSAEFTPPRGSRITSGFGSGRRFNGRVSSRHLGVDFSGVVGAPVHAANRGVVALVDTFFLAGNVVYIDHGGGIVTGYFHLSEALVAVGDTVTRGQQIGLVGATGRVTGPHLHWNARYGALTVNPLDLVELGDWFGGEMVRDGRVRAPEDAGS